MSQWLKFAPPIGYGALPKDALGAGLGALGFGRGTLYSAISPVAGMGNAGTLVGKLSIPPSWATATPSIRTVAAALSAAGAEAVPAAALGEGSLFSSMGLAGMLGSAVGSGGPTMVRGGVRNRMTAIKDLKDKQSPEQLKRLVAQISEQPESVQHHNVDQENSGRAAGAAGQETGDPRGAPEKGRQVQGPAGRCPVGLSGKAIRVQEGDT